MITRWLNIIAIIVQAWLLWWLVRVDLLFHDLNYGTILVLFLVALTAVALCRKSWNRKWVAVSLLASTLFLAGWLNILAHSTTSGSSTYPIPRHVSQTTYPDGAEINTIKEIWQFMGQPTDGWGKCPPGYQTKALIHLGGENTYTACR